MARDEARADEDGGEAASAKCYWSHHHVQSARVVPLGGGQDHRYRLARLIAAYHPTSVLEFGCASGRNLTVLRDAIGEGVRLAGMGDEGLLARQEAGSWDVVFTSSVLDHIPEPQWRRVYDDMVRVARVAVVLHEPVVRNAQGGEWCEADVAQLGVAATPFTYAHDYLGHDHHVELLTHLAIEQTPQFAIFGQLYWVMQRLTRERRSTSVAGERGVAGERAGPL